MNSFFPIIILALVCDFALHTAADLLNVRSLERPVPGSITALYGREVLERSKRYVLEVTRESIVERSSLLVVLFLFWLMGGFDWLDAVVRDWTGSELVRGLAYVGLLALAYSAASVPFEAYHTFVIESRYGFNRTSWPTFLLDRAKGLALGAILGGALIAGVLLLFLTMGDIAWLLCWLTVAAFTLVVQWLGPSLIMPLFNRFTPMPEGALRNAVVAYADSVRFSLENVYVIDGSRRSTRANAFFTGLGRRRRIALFDTLIEQHPPAELVAILAHEVGHYRLHHMVQGLLIGAAHAGVALFLLQLLLGQPGLYDAVGVAQPSLHVGLVGFALLYAPLDAVLAVLVNRISRRQEYAADRFALDTAPDPAALAAALRTLSVVNLTHPNPHPLYVMLHYSHPPLVQRLKAIDDHLVLADSD